MKVLFQSRKTLFSAPGGDTTQILKTKEYLEKLGVEGEVSLELTPEVVSEIDRKAFNTYKKEVLNKALLRWLLASA